MKDRLKSLIKETISNKTINLWELSFEKNLNESTVMAGGGIEGTVGGFDLSDDEKLDEEGKLREVISQMIEEEVREVYEEYIQQENMLRKHIQRILQEKSVNNPHHLTGINVLQADLANIVPILQADYKTLTTSFEQRQSFRTQILHSLDNLTKRVIMNQNAGDHDGDGDIDEIRVVNDENPLIDINPPKKKSKKELEEFEQEGDFNHLDATGRSQGVKTFKKIQGQIENGISSLSDPIDLEAYSKYLIKNIGLYLDKSEDEVSSSLSKISTEPEIGDNVDMENGLGGDEMSPEPEEEEDGIPNDLEEEWQEALNTKVEFVNA